MSDGSLILASRGASQFNLRLTEEMHDQIKADAAANGRSMNAELVYRLSTWRPSTEPVTVSGVDMSKTREALALVKQLEAAAAAAFEACQRLGIKLENEPPR